MSAGRQAGGAPVPRGARGGALAELWPGPAPRGLLLCSPGPLYTAFRRAPGHTVYRESCLVTTPVLYVHH